MTCHVVENYATVDVTVELEGGGPDPEFPFTVRIPPRAYVTKLTIERDGAVSEGRIEDPDAARKEYGSVNKVHATGGLVARERDATV